MAAGDRSPAEELLTEQRIAQELVRRFDLEPPIPLDSLVERFADLEREEIPANCDGLVVGLHGPRPKPLIVLSTGPHEVRQRFTLAHELGHVLLPWHLGSNLACDTRRAFFDWESYRAVVAETEANRFAGELLVPSGWLRKRILELGTEQIAPLLEAVSEARVSAHVACLRLTSVLPAGHVFAIIDQELVVLSGQTAGTGIYPPSKGDLLNRKRLDRFALLTEDLRYGRRRVIWWTYEGRLVDEESDVDPRDSRGVLSDLLERHSGGLEDAQRIQRMVGGVIGAANSIAQREGLTDPGALRARFRSRFAKRRDLPEAMLDDQDFEVWLRKRAEELGT